ncbi:unnamed protein product [Chrysoparadoxa australica]
MKVSLGYAALLAILSVACGLQPSILSVAKPRSTLLLEHRTCGVTGRERRAVPLQCKSSSNAPEAVEEGSQPVALFLLNTVAVLWGTQHSVIKLLVAADDISAGLANLARFSVAALLFLPWTPGLLSSPPPLPFSPVAGEVKTSEIATTWRGGVELGLFMFLGFAFQAIGLETTTASRSAFLLYLNVKLVPFFGFALLGREISTQTWISAFVAFAGTALLSADSSTAPLNIGDLWCLGAAATSALFILRLETYANRCDAAALNSASLWVTAALCAGWASLEVFSGSSTQHDIGAALISQAPLVLYLAVVTTALTNWLQAVGQREVPADRAALIYALDPVYAAVFSNIILGETLGPQGLVGAGLIAGAALWAPLQGQDKDAAPAPPRD